MNLYKYALWGFLLMFQTLPMKSQIDGSSLWFSQGKLLDVNKWCKPTYVCITNENATFQIVQSELLNGLYDLYGSDIPVSQKPQVGCLWLTLTNHRDVKQWFSSEELELLEKDGFAIKYIADKDFVLITGHTEMSLIYGVFHYLRLLQTVDLSQKDLNISEVPAYERRILNHWDNLDGSVERGYAGRSIWQWDLLPGRISPLYKKYARANASIGINGTVLNNVNASPQILTSQYLLKVKAIADEFRPYGIQVYLSVNFASPGVLGGLPDSSPRNEKVVSWWQVKVEEIYTLIPDFGGFLVKANSEGQPGPMDFGCTHAEGANMLADALKPYGGVVMWRAFVYNPGGDDRAKQAYDEFMPLDGQFRDNVILQVKNGPVDFQPREPFSPLFGAMQHTSIMPELQITQEYLGFSDHLVYLGALFQEFLMSDTYARGAGSTVAKVTDGTIYKHQCTGIAGVANIGLDTNWCGHHFAQANWYVFGRLAWNPQKKVSEIAGEWIKQTLTQDPKAIDQIKDIMMLSREAAVNYMTPLGLHHLMGWDHHYGPEPWCEIPDARPDWLPKYYHKADSDGIGFNRTIKGSGAVNQYFTPLKELFNCAETCPEQYLLWFHHLPWNYVMANGNTLWEELCYKYQKGVDQVRKTQLIWNEQEDSIDQQQFKDIQAKLVVQMREAIWWKDACLLYFQTFSNQPFPDDIDHPEVKLEELKELKFDFKHHN